MPNRYALIIGNSEYSDSKLARLRTPDSDVNALTEVLRNPSLGGFDEVEVLLNRDSALVRKTISQFFSNKKRDDLLLLYFSGHGVLDDRGRLFLAVKDTEYQVLRGTSLPASFITDEMDNSNSKRQILILDCCHSGAFARGTKGAIGKSVGTSSAFMGNGYGRVVLTATDSTEYAWEGDALLGSKQNSVFTHYLIKGIETGQADLNQDGVISIDELYDFAHDSVSNSMSKQTPGKWSFRQQGELIIAQNPFVGVNATETQVSHPSEAVKPSELISPSLSIELWKWGTAAGLVTALLLIYPLYVYLPSLYVSGWPKGYAALAFLFMVAAFVPPAWSGWQMARSAKSGWEAVFLGAQAGAIAAGVAFLCIIATASEIYAFKPALSLFPTTISSNQLNGVIAPAMIALFKDVLYTWMAVELGGLLLGPLGCLLKLQRSGEKITFSSFNLTFDDSWWKMILAGILSSILILTLSSAIYELLVDKAITSAELAQYQISTFDKTLLNGFPSLPPLIGLLVMMALGCISTLGSVPDQPSQQRLIAVYILLTALLPWINPLVRLYRYWTSGPTSSLHMFIALLCAVASMILLVFAGKLIRKTGWGKLEPTTGRSYLGAQLVNALLFILLAAPAIAVAIFSSFVVIEAVSMLQGNSSILVKALVNTGLRNQIWFNLIALASIWILYMLLGLLFRPLLWAFNGIVGLFPVAESAPAVPLPPAASTDQPSAEGKEDVPLLSTDNLRVFKTLGLILGLPLILMLGLRLFSRPARSLSPVSPLQTPGFLLTLQANTTPTTTPVISFFPAAATQTVGAAFTQIAKATSGTFALSTITMTPTVTSTPTVTPITTLTPTGALLHLDKSSICRTGPAEEYPEIVPLASGVELPILASSSEHEGWWLVMVRLSFSTNAVCWIENGTVEGNPRKIPAIVYTPQVQQ